MEKKFEQLEIENGFVLNQVEAINYLDWVARTHADQIMQGDEVVENVTELFDDLKEMRDEILQRNYDWVEFVECPASASGMCIEHLVRETELKYMIEDVTEWVLNNCNTDDIPLIFKAKRDQALLERYIKERTQEC